MAAFLLLMTSAFGSILSSHPTAFGQPSDVEEYRLKADLLYNFARFVEWPQPVDAQKKYFIIGVLGEDLFKETLDSLDQKLVNGYQIKIERYQNVSEAISCHILYISPTEKDRWESILQKLRPQSILTVGEGHDFVQKGGMIGFVGEGDIHFEINMTSIQEARLEVSSRLLNLAATIID